MSKKDIVYQRFWQSYDRSIGSEGIEPISKYFYQMFFEKYPQFSELFENVSLAKRTHMLEQSIYYTSQMFLSPKVPLQVARVAKVHKTMGLAQADMEKWFDTMLETVRIFDEQFTDELELIWLAVLNPGILYISARLNKNEN